ncbi:MAG: hypothetical protein ACRDZ4_07240 [Egibacteraceae bacterium]
MPAAVTHEDRVIHRELMKQLRSSIARLREDVEARVDPGLAEIADALELIVDLVTHTHDHTLENRARIEALEAGGTRQA